MSSQIYNIANHLKMVLYVITNIQYCQSLKNGTLCHHKYTILPIILKWYSMSSQIYNIANYLKMVLYVITNIQYCLSLKNVTVCLHKYTILPIT